MTMTMTMTMTTRTMTILLFSIMLLFVIQIFLIQGFQHHHHHHHRSLQQQQQQLQLHHRSQLQKLHMGGYTSDPPKEDDGDDNEVDLSNTHMIFGVRCVEDIIYCGDKDTYITNLRPIIDPATTDDEGDENESGGENESEQSEEEEDEPQPYRETDTKLIAQQNLVKYMLSPDIGDDVYSKPILKDKTILQIGGGGTAIAIAKYSNAKKVVVVDQDELRLQIIQHSYDVLNFNNDNNTPDKTTETKTLFETMILEPNDAFPKCDVIILSTEDEEWINAALSTDRTRTVLFEGAY